MPEPMLHKQFSCNDNTRRLLPRDFVVWAVYCASSPATGFGDVDVPFGYTSPKATLQKSSLSLFPVVKALEEQLGFSRRHSWRAIPAPILSSQRLHDAVMIDVLLGDND